MGYVVGTTARLGRQRNEVSSPAAAARKLVALAANNRVALLFGPEDRGLTNADLRRCHRLVHIPTADFSSINLAQAVMLMSYELHQASRTPPDRPAPPLAVRHEQDGMYATLKEILIRIDYIQRDNPDYWMNKLRRFGNRIQLRAGEVSVIRGICRQIDWYAKNCFEKGRKAALSGKSDPSDA